MLRARVQHALAKTRLTGRESMQLMHAWWKSSSPSLGSSNGSPEHRTQQQQRLPMRTILLQQAKEQGNRTALRLLLWDKEVSLMRYHGWMGYLKQTQWWNQTKRIVSSSTSLSAPFRLLSLGGGSSALKSQNTLSVPGTEPGTSSFSTVATSTGGSGSTTTTSSVEDETTNKNAATTTAPEVAKIAFMVTGRMRLQLTEQLGYTEAHIKTMTPIEASLVLQHEIPPEKYEEKVPALVEEYQQQQEEAFQQQLIQQQRQQLEAMTAAATVTPRTLEEQEMAMEATSLASAAPTTSQSNPIRDASTGTVINIPDPRNNSTTNNKDDDSVTMRGGVDPWKTYGEQLDYFSPFIGNAVDPEDLSECGTGVLWFELVETNPEEETVVGLYRTEKEAEEGQDALEHVSQHRVHLKYSSKFHIRRSIR